jgi:hypothetical protein
MRWERGGPGWRESQKTSTAMLQAAASSGKAKGYRDGSSFIAALIERLKAKG